MLTNRKRNLAHSPLNTWTMARGMIRSTLLDVFVSQLYIVGCYAERWPIARGIWSLEHRNKGLKKILATQLEVFVSQSPEEWFLQHHQRFVSAVGILLVVRLTNMKKNLAHYRSHTSTRLEEWFLQHHWRFVLDCRILLVVTLTNRAMSSRPESMEVPSEQPEGEASKSEQPEHYIPPPPPPPPVWSRRSALSRKAELGRKGKKLLDRSLSIVIFVSIKLLLML